MCLAPPSKATQCASRLRDICVSCECAWESMRAMVSCPALERCAWDTGLVMSVDAAVQGNGAVANDGTMADAQQESLCII